MKFHYKKYQNSKVKKTYVYEKEYLLDSGINVKLKIHEFMSENNEEINGDSAVFIIPGWGTDAHSQVVKNFAQEYANSFNQNAYSISSRAMQHKSENIDVEILEEESRAILKYIVDSGKKNVTLTGYSQGGNKAMNIVAIMEKENPEISIQGLALVDSLGLYNQGKSEVVKNFISDAFVKTPAQIFKKGSNISDLKNGISALMSIFKTTVGEIMKSHIHYFQRLKRELEELGRKNKHIAEIKSPIVLISGAEDLVSKKEEFLSKEVESINELSTGSVFDVREHYLKEHCFKKSPYVRALFPKKNGTHSLPCFRPHFIASSAKRMLDSYNRKHQ